MEICAEWEKITNLQLEHDTYDKIILGDVNNYIAVNTPKQVDYDTYLGVKKENPHYVFQRLGPDRYTYQATKCKGRFEFHNLALHKNKSFLVVAKALYQYFVHGEDYKEYISNKGSKIIKKNQLDDRQIQVESGKWLQTVFIDYKEKPFPDYDIRFDYYIKKVEKEIAGLEPAANQYKLF
jgi:hypothetical protein